jgi:hypothetical protein
MVYLNKPLEGFGITPPKPIQIGQDNMAATTDQLRKLQPQDKTHCSARYIYINDLQKKGVCKVQYLPTGNIPSDARRAHQGTLGPTEFHKHIQVLLLGQNELTWTHTKANKPTAPS